MYIFFPLKHILRFNLILRFFVGILEAEAVPRQEQPREDIAAFLNRTDNYIHCTESTAFFNA